jgi:hypothetical protein
MSGSIEPAGLISEPMGNVATEQPGTALFPSTAFEGQDWLGLTKMLGRGLNTAQAEMGTVDDYGRQTSAPEPSIDAADANKAYGIPGKLTFSAPLPASVAQSMQDAKRDEITREDAAARAPPGFWPGAARLGAGFVAGALDPLNLAALFVPGLGEARSAGILARAGLPGLGAGVLADVGEGGAAAIPSLGARMAVRGVSGAVSGAVAQAPLVGLRYDLSRQEQGDYSALDALADVMTMGAGLGALGHVTGGVIGDVLGQRFARSGAGAMVATDPAVAEAAMRTSVAQLVEGNPVEVQPVTMAGYVQRSNAAAVVMARVASLQREADALRREADQVPGHLETVESPESMIRTPVLDAATQSRADAVLDELTDPTNPPTAARRAELLAEHQMLSEGGVPGAALEQARSESQRRGLLTAAARIDDRIRELREGQPDTAATGQLTVSASVAAPPPTSFLDQAWLRAQGATPSGYDMGKGAASLTDEVQAALDRGDGVTLVADGGSRRVPIVAIDRGMMQDARGQRWGTLSIAADATGKEGVEITRGGGVPTIPSEAASTRFDRSAQLAHGAPPPDEAAITRMADGATRDVRPDGPGGLPAALETQLADIEDTLSRADAAGLLGDPERAEIETANGWLEQAKAYGNAALQAAACIGRGMV